ncbi:DUF2202 domain-containing protein [Corynebacterium comes]|uniref:DUF2202 domain-containing protein n=1 Tax=Corynebacterium comes TaxID=2675218 RepID=A0A6B8VGM0_9CORY|nr:DUF2202 domain-containing protein [Corynebacterium comes]QGU04442.1 hypothetical protein CETAM_05875 [Corynebacterium comes]
MALARKFGAAVLAATLTLTATQVADAAGPRRGQSGQQQVAAAPTATSTTVDINSELLYLIEEEKLAYDVYRAMLNAHGTRIFENISASEATHQNAALPLLQKRGLTDPRLGAGKFSDPGLQKLYDELVAKGVQSPRDALEVGRTIEEMDIADLEQVLAGIGPEDADVRTVMENLLKASRNHLSAFNRQLAL